MLTINISSALLEVQSESQINRVSEMLVPIHLGVWEELQQVPGGKRGKRGLKKEGGNGNDW